MLKFGAAAEAEFVVDAKESNCIDAGSGDVEVKSSRLDKVCKFCRKD